jgi:hypothetical protein
MPSFIGSLRAAGSSVLDPLLAAFEQPGMAAMVEKQERKLDELYDYQPSGAHLTGDDLLPSHWM